MRIKNQDIHIPMKKRGNLWIAEVKMDQLGENRFDIFMGRKTNARNLFGY